MKLLIKFLKNIWAAIFCLNFLLSFLLLFPFVYISLSKKKWYKYAHTLKKVWSFYIFSSSGIIYKVVRKTKLDEKKPYVYCSNHTSYLDIPLIRLAVPGYYHYVGKIELLKNPFFKIFFRTMDIPVDRESKISSYKAYIRAGQDLDEGIGIVMFPEGTISSDVPILSEFKLGPFKLAIEKKIPIVPITLLGNWKILHGSGKSFGGPGVIKAIIHEPIETKEMTDKDVDKLKDCIFGIINNALIEHESR